MTKKFNADELALSRNWKRAFYCSLAVMKDGESIRDIVVRAVRICEGNANKFMVDTILALLKTKNGLKPETKVYNRSR